ncbi:MAG TPA: LytTR family DNA-binding domain-containing protein [Chitinophagaceae bacterium]|nr:LytTR family DNA-binding domain-containing protein [Chitinophagaceae bacterium]
MLNCIAVDDEKLVLDLLVDNIQKIPFLHLAARCKNAMEAADVLHKEKIDLVFLDIQMPGLNGLQFVQSLQHTPMVIFVTAYKQYAFDAFDLNVVDYLLKPVSFERFLKACNRANELYNLQQGQSGQQDKANYFFVYVEYNLVKISIPDILYIEGMKDYIKIFLASSARPVITKMSMKAIEEKLHSFRFIRSHKSYIVAADKIISIKRDLIVIGDTELPLSENYKPNLEKMLPR